MEYNEAKAVVVQQNKDGKFLGEFTTHRADLIGKMLEGGMISSYEPGDKITINIEINLEND